MREIIVVCRSTKRSRVRVASVLDRYLWRIADRTWRGRASNACLDRMARELRAVAKRNTAVAVHEIRSSRESRVPIIRIGSRHAFSPGGIAPVASHANRADRRRTRSDRQRRLLALLRIAVLFHDLGKATRLFQNKLRRALRPNARPEADAVRHELHSATVWDHLVGDLDDRELIERLQSLDPEQIDVACEAVVDRLRSVSDEPDAALPLRFAQREGGLAHAIGLLILTHHRLPDGAENHRELLGTRHAIHRELDRNELHVADGPAFWQNERWLRRLREAAIELEADTGAPGLDMALRVSLMCADHLGSALRQPGIDSDHHLGNTLDGKAADSLDVHVRRVERSLPGCFDMLHRYRESYPAIGEEAMPIDLLHPAMTTGPFAWQAAAAQAARMLCKTREGGFFACLMAGTGTGKTRGAPTVLSAAAFADVRPERRYLRVTLALGLRSLASQSAQEYVSDLEFDDRDVAVLIGRPPVRFEEGDTPIEGNAHGSESLVALPRWLRVARAAGAVPEAGAEGETNWLRGLSHDTDRGLPATLDLVLEKAGRGRLSARRLVATPVVVGTIDQIMQVASPTRSRYLMQAVRVLTADLILDEIDQYEPEDIAAIGRLVYQAAAGGRRVIIMSATLPRDVAVALYEAYREGWRSHADAFELDDLVNVLCCGDEPDSCVTNAREERFTDLYDACRDRTSRSLDTEPVRRKGRILPATDDWAALVEQVDTSCSELHESTSSMVDGTRVSIGFVRMTRIAHAAALAAQLPAGSRNRRLRLKICLHSRFPRLHRSWIERELKRALTRKGRDPNAGLASFCKRHGLVERVRELGCSQLEIVVVTSPVIETGNDLDFDWAIIDPSSTRAIVQAAGRVWRHRTYDRPAVNVHILGRSPIVMTGGGRLAYPGVETPPHRDTLVGKVTLDEFVERRFSDLAGDQAFERIDASICFGRANMPLWDKETDLRERMVCADDSEHPLGCYIRSSTARLNGRMVRSRSFRRRVTRDIEYFEAADESGIRQWFVDFAPGTRQSCPRLAEDHGLHVDGPQEQHLVFSSLSQSAWADHDERHGESSSTELRRLTEILMPDYATQDGGPEPEPIVTYGEWTGLTRGVPEDLFEPFGKSAKNQ